MNKESKILITGGSGLVGQNLTIKYFIQESIQDPFFVALPSDKFG